jgi:hypothetical protein
MVQSARTLALLPARAPHTTTPLQAATRHGRAGKRGGKDYGTQAGSRDMEQKERATPL